MVCKDGAIGAAAVAAPDDVTVVGLVESEETGIDACACEVGCGTSGGVVVGPCMFCVRACACAGERVRVSTKMRERERFVSWCVCMCVHCRSSGDEGL